MLSAYSVLETISAKSEMASEPTEAYYQRIFAEFSNGRKAAGAQPISYVRFVEKVVRQEQVLKKQLRAANVRLKVVQTKTGPVFKPIKIE